MYTKSLLSVAAVVGAANASPLLKRQTVVATESITSVATVSTSAASTPGINPTVSVAMPSGDGSGNSYPLYPCAPGFSLTYAQMNATLQQPIGEFKQALGEWATAAIFPNVTASMGGSTVGATHTYHALGADFLETLVNSTANSDDGSAFLQFVWNSTAPILAGDLEIASYSSVLKAYDPNFSMLGRRSNETFVQTFTNACAANQENARSTLQSLQSLQFGLINATSSTNSTGGNGGSYISSVVATNTVSTTNTNTAIDTNTILATSTNDVTQTNTLIPLTATSTGTTIQQTVTPVTVAVTSTAATVASTADTTVVTANPNTATTVVAVSTTSV